MQIAHLPKVYLRKRGERNWEMYPYKAHLGENIPFVKYLQEFNLSEGMLWSGADRTRSSIRQDLGPGTLTQQRLSIMQANGGLPITPAKNGTHKRKCLPPKRAQSMKKSISKEPPL